MGRKNQGVNHSKRQTYQKSQYQSQSAKSAKKMNRDELSMVIDNDCKGIGLAISHIYKTLTSAMMALPNMELHTEAMCLAVGDNGISVCVRSDGCEGCDERDGCDRYQDDDEEGHIYDGD